MRTVFFFDYYRSLSHYTFLRQTITHFLRTGSPAIIYPPWFQSVNTSIAPYLIIIKVCVTRHLIIPREKGVGQGATLPVKRVPIVMQQAGKRHSDVPSSCSPAVVTRQPTETQGGRVTPGFEGVSQDGVHQIVRQGGWDGRRWIAVDTANRNRKCIKTKLYLNS